MYQAIVLIASISQHCELLQISFIFFRNRSTIVWEVFMATCVGLGPILIPQIFFATPFYFLGTSRLKLWDLLMLPFPYLAGSGFCLPEWILGM